MNDNRMWREAKPPMMRLANIKDRRGVFSARLVVENVVVADVFRDGFSRSWMLANSVTQDSSVLDAAEMKFTWGASSKALHAKALVQAFCDRATALRGKTRPLTLELVVERLQELESLRKRCESGVFFDCKRGLLRAPGMLSTGLVAQITRDYPEAHIYNLEFGQTPVEETMEDREHAKQAELVAKGRIVFKTPGKGWMYVKPIVTREATIARLRREHPQVEFFPGVLEFGA